MADFLDVENGRKNDRPQLAASLALAEKAVIPVAKINHLARDVGFVLNLANEAETNGIGGFVFCDLPDIDTTTSAARMVLTMMASVAEFEARWVCERTKKVLAAAKARGVCLGGYRQGAAERASERKKKAITEAEGLRSVLGPMVCSGLSFRGMADALAGVGKLSSTERAFAPAQIGRILQRLGLSGKLLSSDQAWVAA